MAQNKILITLTAENKEDLKILATLKGKTQQQLCAEIISGELEKNSNLLQDFKNLQQKTE